MIITTEALEEEMKRLEESIQADRTKVTNDQTRFQTIAAELRNRRSASDEQPVMATPTTLVDALRKENENLRYTVHQLSMKITAMEHEQAKLVVEAEIAKASKLEIEERLSLVVKNLVTPATNS